MHLGNIIFYSDFNEGIGFTILPIDVIVRGKFSDHICFIEKRINFRFHNDVFKTCCLRHHSGSSGKKSRSSGVKI